MIKYFAGEAFRVLVGVLQKGVSPPDVEKGGDTHEVVGYSDKNTAYRSRNWNVCSGCRAYFDSYSCNTVFLWVLGFFLFT